MITTILIAYNLVGAALWLYHSILGPPIDRRTEERALYRSQGWPSPVGQDPFSTGEAAKYR